MAKLFASGLAFVLFLAALATGSSVRRNGRGDKHPLHTFARPQKHLQEQQVDQENAAAYDEGAPRLLKSSEFNADSGDILVTIKVQYPASNLPSGSTVGIRGSNPLSWTETIPLSPVKGNSNEWSVELPIGGVNSTYPTWIVATKVVVEVPSSSGGGSRGNKLLFSSSPSRKRFGMHNNTKVLSKSSGGSIVWQLGCNDRFTLKEDMKTLEVTLWPWFTQKKGETPTYHNVHSPQLNNNRSVWLYIPPGLIENPFRYEKNVNVFQDGQNLAPLWNVPEHLNKHIMDETMESLFVIGPYNMDANRTYEYTYVPDPFFGGGGGDIYLDFVEQTLVPFFAAKYQIMTAQTNLGILGSSLGGLIACYAGVTRPKIYSKVGCMSSSFWWDYDNFRKTIVPQLTTEHAKTQKYYIDSGDSGDTDDGRGESSLVATMFARFGTLGPASSSASNANGNPTGLDNNFIIGTNLFYYLQRGGHHNEYYWSARFRHPMQWLYFHDAIWNTPEPG